MKKIISCLLVLIVLFSLTGCAAPQSTNTKYENNTRFKDLEVSYKIASTKGG